jgi:hypothetical protein
MAWDHFSLFFLRPLAQRKDRQARAEAQSSQRKDKKAFFDTSESYYLAIGCIAQSRFPLCALRSLCARKVHQGCEVWRKRRGGYKIMRSFAFAFPSKRARV